MFHMVVEVENLITTALKQSEEKLQIADVQNRDFAACKDVIRKGDLVFLDPPYAVSSKSTDNEYDL